MADIPFDPECNDTTELLSKGVQAITMHDYGVAVQALSKVSELLVAQHGEKHESLAEVYLYYGKALLELYREEVGPLGDALQKNVPSSDDSDEDEVETAEKVENKAEPKPEEANTNGTSMEQDDGEKPSGSEAKAAQNGEESESTEEKAGEQEEEATDLQVAWEVLELAKLIFEKKGEQSKKFLAETYILLGEVSLESENFESAVSDIRQGLELQKAICEPDSRTLAQTHYKLGMALSTNSQIDEAIENFNVSLGILKGRIKSLSESPDKEKYVDEIKDMVELVPEIEEKISDMRSFKEEAVRKLTSAAAAAKITTSPQKPGSSVVNDISHLVKRKRKLDEVIEDKKQQSEVPPKKPSP